MTGAKGFVGKNLCENLKNIRDGKDHVHILKGLRKSYQHGDEKINFPYNPADLEIVEFDVDSTKDELENACRDCDFVFNFAGVNRPQNDDEFMKENYGFAGELLELLKKYHNTCPVMLSSSIQASLSGRYAESDYGKSKLAGEKLFFRYSQETGAKVLVYRFPNLFGKWCRPNYNSVVATFCNNIARDLPIKISDRNTSLTLLYIDDLVEEMIRALNEEEHHCEFNGLNPMELKDGRYCFVPQSSVVTLGEIADMLYSFKAQAETLIVPDIPDHSFVKKLYSTFLSYLPENKIVIPLQMNSDNRGSFTELLRFRNCGQISVNISNPGITKGQHWHNSKWEFFIVVSGHGLIQERRIGDDKILEFEVDGEHITAVHMLPGYTHNIINLSDTEELVTVMWANEMFDASYPDTYREKVKE